jgi:hypothetical protein
MCMIDDADYRLEFYNAKMVAARKQHRCCECGRDIQRGEIYHSASGKGDGRVERYRTCGHCRVAGEWLEKECGGHLIGGIEEDIHEHLQEGAYGFGLARLAAGMRRKWARFDGKGLMAIPVLPGLSA